MNLELRALSAAAPAVGNQSMQPGPVPILLAGGDTLFREGLKRLFEATALSIIGEVDTLTAIVGLDGLQQPAVIIAADPDLTTHTPVAAWPAACRRTWPAVRIVVVLSRGGDREVIAALRSGADGCLFTAMSPRALVHAVSLVALGENVFPTRISSAFANLPAQPGQARLTPRERDILRGLLAGHSNKMIANGLGTTDMTVKAQLRHLLRKLGVSNRTQAALWAHENGFD